MPATPDIALTEFQTQVVIGTLLGDSSLSRPKGGKNYHLSCYHAKSQIPWLTMKHGWLIPASRPIHHCAYLDRRDGKVREGDRFHTVSIPPFTEIESVLYRDRVKVILPALLARFTHPAALACLIGDDGSWDGAGVSIASKQFMPDENIVLAQHITQCFGVNTVPQLEQKYPYMRITADSVERVRHLCFPFLPVSLHYKFGPPDYQTRLVGKVERSCALCGDRFLCYESSACRYCSRKCAVVGRPMGYATRDKERPCDRCGTTFTVYNKRQTKCPECRGVPFPEIPCLVCGRPVRRVDHRTCSKECGAVLGHRNRRIG